VSWNPDPRFATVPVQASPTLLILTALASEAESLVSLGKPEVGLVPPPGELRRIWRPQRNEAWVGYTGLGRGAARAAILPFKGDRAPKRIVFAGVAGALRGDLDTGDLVVVDAAVTDGVEGGERVETSPTLTAAVEAALERSGLSARRRGSGVEVGKILGVPDDKRALARRFPDACVVAMEDHAAILAARKVGAEIAVVRVVVDRLNDSVPDLSPGLDAAGRPLALKLAAHLVRQPSALRALPGLARSFGTAKAVLDRALHAFLEL
jgi:nucleoside phosphorylase